MLRRDFNKVAAFRSTTFLIVENFIFSQVILRTGYFWQTLCQQLIQLSSFFLLSVRGFPHNLKSLFLFLSCNFSTEGADVGAKYCVIVFISVTLMGKFLTCCHVPCARNLPLMGIPPCCMQILPFMHPVFLDLWSLIYFLELCARTWRHTSYRWVYSYDSIAPFCLFGNISVCKVYGWWKCPPRYRIWCCVCPLPSHRTEYLIIHFREGTPIRYYSGFRMCCNGSCLHSSRRRWDFLHPLHLLGEHSFWTYAPWFHCWGVSSMGSSVRCCFSWGKRLGEITRLAWDRSRCRFCCQTRSCILSLRCSRLICGQHSYLICLLWSGWLPARCCPGCLPFTLIFPVRPPWMGMIHCSGRVGHTCNR